MPIQVKLDLEKREDLIQEISEFIVGKADSEDEAADMAYKLSKTVEKHEDNERVQEIYEQLLKHALTEEFKELVKHDLEDWRLGAIYALDDVKYVKKEVRKAVCGRVSGIIEAENPF